MGQIEIIFLVYFQRINYFAGYNSILKAFFNEMNNRELHNYSEALKNAAIDLLTNEKLINYYIPIIYNKTKYNVA